VSDANKKLHIGIIMDGNRRWAKAQGLKPWEGHKAGAKAFEQLLSSLKDKSLPVRELTCYTFSMQNFNRSKEEKEKLFNLMLDYFTKFKNDPSIVENQIKITFLGRIELLPSKLQECIGALENQTKNYSGSQLNFALAYGGREELIDAVKRIVAKSPSQEDVSEALINQNLYSDHQPDFIIRTSGEKRTSNFLIWQSSYSEWFFLEKHWPDFIKDDLKNCIEEFNQNRQRRFGK